MPDGTSAGRENGTTTCSTVSFPPCCLASHAAALSATVAWGESRGGRGRGGRGCVASLLLARVGPSRPEARAWPRGGHAASHGGILGDRNLLLGAFQPPRTVRQRIGSPRRRGSWACACTASP